MRNMWRLVYWTTAVVVGHGLGSLIVTAQDDLCTTTTCLAEGETECDRSTTTCPPCMYGISGGYSCYSLDASTGACPYEETIEICSTSSSATASESSSAFSTASTAASGGLLTESSPTTTAPSVSTSSSTSSFSSTESSQSASTSASASTNQDSRSGSSGNLRTTSSASLASDSSSEVVRANGSSGDSAEAPMVLNIAVISVGVVGVLAVAVFVTRRMRRNRTEYRMKTPETDSKPFTFQEDLRSARNTNRHGGGGGHSGDHDHKTNSQRGGRGPRRGSNAPLPDHSANPSVLSMASLTSSTLEFSSTQYMAQEAGEFGSYRATSSTPKRKISNASRRWPPQQHVLAENEEYNNPDQPFETLQDRTQLAMLGLPTALGNSKSGAHRPKYEPALDQSQSSGISVARYDEYDIVDPGTIGEGERRDTEILVAAGRFPKFSTFSESDVLEMHEPHSNNKRFHPKEREI